MTVKVIVTGAYSTGKTTLVEAIARELVREGWRTLVLPDVSRDCPMPLNRSQTEASSLWLATTQISRELAATARSPDVVVCDRGMPDILAHMLDGGAMSGSSIEAFTAALHHWCGTYDVLLGSTIDPAILPQPDGVRDLDPAYRERLAHAARQILSPIAGVEWLPTDRETRIARSLCIIADKLKTGA